MAALISYFAWKRRNTLGASTLSWLMLAIAFWSAMNALEYAFVDQATKLIFAKFSYIGIHSTTPLFLILSLTYSQRTKWLTRRNLLLIWFVPVMMMLLAATNDLHHLIWTHFSRVPEDPFIMVYHYGPGFILGTGLAYSIFLLAIINLAWAARILQSIYRRQVITILLASLIPWGVNLAYVFKIDPFPGKDLTPIGFMLTGVLITWSIFRQQLLILAPIARSKIVDTISDIVIVIDHQWLISDLNPVAQFSLGVSANDVIGKPACEVLEKWPHIQQQFQEAGDIPTKKLDIRDIDGHWYEERIYPLAGRRDRPQGWIIILRDISEEKELETALRNNEELYRNVTEQANDGITIVQDFIVKYANPQLLAMLGYATECIIGESYLKFIAVDQVDFIQNMHTRRMQGEQMPTRYETDLRHKDGYAIPAEFNVAIMNYEGRPAVLATIRDVSEKIEAQRELQEYARQQRLLNEITRSAIETTGLEETLQLLADRLGELIHADGCYITLWDDEQQATIPAAASGALRNEYRELQLDPSEPTITKAVIKRGTSLVIEDVHNTPYLSPKNAARFPTSSMLAIPLIVDGTHLGAVLIAFNTHHTFTAEEINLGEQVGRQIGLAIFKEHLLATAHRRATEAETLRQAGAAIAATLNLDEAIDRILEQLNRVVPYDSASVQLLRDKQLEIVGQHGFPNPDEILHARFPIAGDNPNSIVVKTLQPHIIKDASIVYDVFKAPPHNRIRGWMGVPLMIQDRLIGMIALDTHQPGQFTSEHARLASAFAAQVAIALENARLYEKTHRLAILDSLTGIYNRGYFMTLAQQEYQRSCRYRRPLSIIMIDIDHFKKVNDTYGHLIGDQVLRAFALLCSDNLRETDIIARYGGEEFVILMPETPSQGLDAAALSAVKDGQEQSILFSSAKIAANRICNVIANTPIQTERGDISITISLGVVELTNKCETIETLLDRADTALYIAKQRGRNQYVVWNP